MTAMRGLACPMPYGANDVVQMAHGGGGRVMERLLDTVIRPAFADTELSRRHDGAVLDPGGRIAFTTDSYVVRPLFFPGGDIGALAVNGTVNDLAMCGARPLCLSVGLILEEGLPLATLIRVVTSMRDAACAANLRIVTGDVKVVDRGKADSMFINTSGIGRIETPHQIGPEMIEPGDAIILSGDIGRHGVAVLAAREGLGLESAIESDCAPLASPVLALLAEGVRVRCLRDPTRGGVASALVEIAETSKRDITIEERAVTVRADVAAACELLGLDPLHIANEGRFLAFVAKGDAPRALEVLRRFDVSRDAAVIGQVAGGALSQVSCRGPFGATRVIDMLSGEQLPRIC